MIKKIMLACMLLLSHNLSAETVSMDKELVLNNFKEEVSKVEATLVNIIIEEQNLASHGKNKSAKLNELKKQYVEDIKSVLRKVKVNQLQKLDNDYVCEKMFESIKYIIHTNDSSKFRSMVKNDFDMYVLSPLTSMKNLFNLKNNISIMNDKKYEIVEKMTTFEMFESVLGSSDKLLQVSNLEEAVKLSLISKYINEDEEGRAFYYIQEKLKMTYVDLLNNLNNPTELKKLLEQGIQEISQIKMSEDKYGFKLLGKLYEDLLTKDLSKIKANDLKINETYENKYFLDRVSFYLISQEKIDEINAEQEQQNMYMYQEQEVANQ